MKFVVEALGLTTGGGKQLAADLLVHLPKGNGHEFVFLLPDVSDWPLGAGRNVKLMLISKPRTLAGRYYFLNRTVPRLCAQWRADALLCLGNFAPQNPACPTVVLIHNAHMVAHDPMVESRLTVRERLRQASLRTVFGRLRAGVRVVVQTPTMKNLLLSRCRLDPQHVTIIPNRHSIPPAPDDGWAIRAETGTRPFTFVYVAPYACHKNQEILPLAVKKLSAYTAQAFRCVITISPQQHPNARDLLELIAREGLTSILVNVGPVPPARLGDVYRAADALIFPSLLESFTRTFSEAMYFNLPIVASDREYARDICQDAALYFDPMDPASIAQCMARVMVDRKLRLTLIRRGRQLLDQSPGWDEIAARFISVLEAAARGTPDESLATTTATVAAARHEFATFR